MKPEEAFLQALEVRSKAYAPYSKFQVGAALKLKNQNELSLGCNVENSSYGGTICAERSAFLQAVAKWGTPLEPEFLVLVTDAESFDTPCGFCLQVISEFAEADFPIHLANLQGIQKTLLLKELLPQPFDKSHLPVK